jgi:hypothetical protein
MFHTRERIVSVGAFRRRLACSASATANVRLRRCNGSSYQLWTALGNGLLRSALAGRCLRDPGGSNVVGTALKVGSCRPVSSRLWWLP